MEKKDDKTFENLVVAKVGFISVKFQFTTVLTEIDPPKHLKAGGRDRTFSSKETSVKKPVVDLSPISENEVEVSYKIQCKRGG